MTNPHLIEFIQSFNTHEIKVVEEYLEKMGATEELQLFRSIVLKEQTILEEEETINAKSSNLLKNSLYDKIIDAFLSDDYLQNEILFDKVSIGKFDLRKKTMIIKALHHKLNQGNMKTLKLLIEETLQLAKEYEAYDILAEVLLRKKYMKAVYISADEFEKLNKEIAFYEYCHKAVYIAADCYHHIVVNTTYIKSLSKSKLDKLISTSLHQMEKDFKKTKSHEVNYFLNIFQVWVCEYKKNYLKAIYYCRKLINILKKSKVIYQKNRIGNTFLGLGHYEIFVGKYMEAIEHLIEARQHFTSDHSGYILAEEQEFCGWFYAGAFKQAEKSINAILKYPIGIISEAQYATNVYYHCCNLFALKKYKEALVILNEPLEIEKDKSGWNIGVRILKIMLFVELNKLDEASTALEALRKYMERITKSKTEVDARTVLIVKLLRELEKNDFVFDPKNAAASKLLKTLSAKNKPISWEHYTPEMIKFHDWVGRSYEL